MPRYSREEFEEMVGEGIKAIPERFLKKMDNVAVVIEYEPTKAQIKKLKIRRNWTLFGLYEGIPLSSRGVHYSSVLPDKITIFQKPIESAAKKRGEIMSIVKNTVWHEIAHHFGMDEARVRRAENKRKK